MYTPYNNTSTPDSHYFTYVCVYTHVYIYVSGSVVDQRFPLFTVCYWQLTTCENFTEIHYIVEGTVIFQYSLHLSPLSSSTFQQEYAFLPSESYSPPSAATWECVLQCLSVWIMGSSQAVFKINKWGESDGARSELQGGCGKTVNPKFLTASAVQTLLWLGIFKSSNNSDIFLVDNSTNVSIQTSYCISLVVRYS